MNWASTPSMPEGWMSPGGSSPARQYTPRTLMPMGYGVLCLKPPKSGLQNGAPPRRAPGVSTRLLEALHLLFRNVRLALFGHPTRAKEFPLLGAKRTFATRCLSISKQTADKLYDSASFVFSRLGPIRFSRRQGSG